MLKLYDYFRSSSSYRVRIGLHLKGLEFETIHVDLVKGEQRDKPYIDLNPQGLVPLLVDGDFQLSQSPAILEYLEEKYPQKSLLPEDMENRAYVRQMAMIIASDIHPLNNLKVWKGYIGGVLKADDQQMKDWYAHWIHQGLQAYEKFLSTSGRMGTFTCGDTPTLADIHLLPQLYNARRFFVSIDAYPNIM
ncbi:MAG: maleylacetoacetate isomerase, partial [Alphaproteobacteria bacterium]